jgi:hypothetical protein
MQARVSVDVGNAAVELALEDTSLSAEAALEQGAQMIRTYWRDILVQRRTTQPRGEPQLLP